MLHYEGELVLEKLGTEWQTHFTLKENPFNSLMILIEVIRIEYWLHISRGKKNHDINLS